MISDQTTIDYLQQKINEASISISIWLFITVVFVGVSYVWWDEKKGYWKKYGNNYSGNFFCWCATTFTMVFVSIFIFKYLGFEQIKDIIQINKSLEVYLIKQAEKNTNK